MPYCLVLHYVVTPYNGFGRLIMGGRSEIKVGCCGFVTAQKKYFRLFGLIEIQSTFYQLPKPQTAEKWRASAPAGFEFTMKAWQLITHEPSSPTYRRLTEKIAPGKFDRYGRFRPTEEVLAAWQRTALFAKTLGATLVLFQCPASFHPTEENVANMRDFFGQIPKEGLQLAWEPRGKWPEKIIHQLCEELELIHCVDPFKDKPLFGDFQYFRLHGITGYRYHYTDEDLEQLIKWARKRPSYLLFNNNWMKEDALRLMELTSPIYYYSEQ
jgi:uncharacterized protein YecE (DUF72 family)